MILFPTFRWTNWSSRMQSDQRKSRKQQISHSCFVSSAALHLLYCIVSIHLYSASCIAHQSEALPVLSSFIFLFIHSGCFYSTPSVPLLLGGVPDTTWILCRS